MSDPSPDAMASPPPASAPAPPAVAPYHPPPSYPPPAAPSGRVTDGRAASSVVFGVLGLVFSFPAGLPGMIAGPIAYFLAGSAKTRIAESNGALGGEGAATTGRILGVVAFSVGCVFTLLWLIVIFTAMLSATAGG